MDLEKEPDTKIDVLLMKVTDDMNSDAPDAKNRVDSVKVTKKITIYHG